MKDELAALVLDEELKKQAHSDAIKAIQAGNLETSTLDDLKHRYELEVATGLKKFKAKGIDQLEMKMSKAETAIGRPASSCPPLNFFLTNKSVTSGFATSDSFKK